MGVTHFSNYDCNDPVAPLEDTNPSASDESDDDEEVCPAGEDGCFINLKEGSFSEEIGLPKVNILGEEVAPRLLYNSQRANPTEVIDIKLSLDVGGNAELGQYIGFELYLEGEQTDSFFFDSTLQSGEIGRYRYLWDGHDAQGNLLPPGTYNYGAKFSIPYRSQYCYALDGIFGNPPDCEFGGTGIFVDTTNELWVRGTVELDTQLDSPFGAGWVLNGLQRLYEDEAGHILISNGERNDEFYFLGKDLLADVRGAIKSAGKRSPSGGTPVIHHEGIFSTGALLTERESVSNESRQALNHSFDPPWTTIADYPFAVMDNIAAEWDGMIYSVGGYDGSNSLRSAYLYNPTTDSWSQLADMTHAHRKPAGAFINGLFYVAGGWTETVQPTDTLEIYDPRTDSWQVGSAMPLARVAGAGVALGGQLYVIGGCTGFETCEPSNEVLRYNPLLDSWTEMASYPEPIAWQSCGAIDGRIYCAGGVIDNTNSTKHSYVYEPANNNWTPVADMTQDHWGAAFTAANGFLYISGGVTNNLRAQTNQGFFYAPLSDSWTPIENSNYIRYRGGSACGLAYIVSVALVPSSTRW
jgi:N-acetylneuraminic acid mutarotase